jgi:hypothetical protein
MPFPSKPKADVAMREPHFVEPVMALARPTGREPVPMLRNPYEPPATVEDEVSLSPPQHPMSAPAPAAAEFDDGAVDSRREPPQTAYFDAMWPAETKPAKPTADKSPAEIASAPQAPKLRQSPEPRSVAILKSGVVDGMGYTLYVDGSIEAELPQGTLRFASINELRSHLENNA